MFHEAAFAEVSGETTATPLARTTATELCMLAALVPVMVSNIAVKYNRKIYTSDASLGLGAVVPSESSDKVARALWRGSDKRGCYTQL